MARKVKCLVERTLRSDREVNVPDGFDEWEAVEKLKWLTLLYNSHPDVFDKLSSQERQTDIKISQIGKSSYPTATRSKEEIFPG